MGGQSSGIRPTLSKLTPSWSAGGKGVLKPLVPAAFKGAQGGYNTSFNKGGAGKGFASAGYGFVKGKGKGKMKGKPFVAPPSDDPFWSEKSANENRVEGDGTLYTGTVQNYNSRAGWGFLLPDDASSLPEEIQATLAKASAEAAARGKNVGDPNLIYFRKPDLAEGFEPQKESSVSFQLYTDDKGVGAFNISGL